MRILSTESFKRIAPLLRENYANLHAQMEVRLSPDTAAMFARYTLQPSRGGAQWSVSLPDEDRLRPFSEASELEKDQISMTIKRALGELKGVFSAQADKIVEVPDPEAIFFCTSGSRMQVVLTQWGFRRINQKVGTSIIRLCLERADSLTDSPVVLRLVNADGSPAADKDFALLVFNNEVPFTTDAAGCFNAGHVKVGAKFRVELPDGKKSEPFTVEQGRDFYEIRLAMETTLTVRVQDQEGTGLKGYRVSFEGESKETDGQGEAVFGPMDYDGSRVVSVSADGFQPQEHTLVADPAQNVVVFTRTPAIIDSDEGDDDPQPPFPPTKGEIRVQVVDKKGVPQCGMRVKVFCRKGFENAVTDSQGWITLKREDLEPGETPRIELMRPKPSRKGSGQPVSTPPPPVQLPPQAPGELPPQPPVDNQNPPIPQNPPVEKS